MSEEQSNQSHAYDDFSGLEAILLIIALFAGAYYSFQWAVSQGDNLFFAIGIGALGFITAGVVTVSGLEFIKSNPILSALIALGTGFYLGKYGLPSLSFLEHYIH